MKNHRALSILAAASMLFTLPLLGGCGEEDGNKPVLDAKNPVTITVWHYYNGVQQTYFDKMVKDFNETVGMEQGIIVKASSKSSINELADSVIGSVSKDSSDDPPDIFAAYSETAYKLDKMGVLADLKEYLTDKEISAYVDDYISEGKFSGSTLKIFPTAKSTELMMINKTDWDKFASAEGVSADDLKTVEGLTSAAAKYYDYTDALTPDIPNDGKAMFGRDSVANYMIVGGKQLGCEYVKINDDGTASLDTDKEAVRKLWETIMFPL